MRYDKNNNVTAAVITTKLANHSTAPHRYASQYGRVTTPPAPLHHLAQSMLRTAPAAAATDIRPRPLTSISQSHLIVTGGLALPLLPLIPSAGAGTGNAVLVVSRSWWGDCTPFIYWRATGNAVQLLYTIAKSATKWRLIPLGFVVGSGYHVTKNLLTVPSSTANKEPTHWWWYHLLYIEINPIYLNLRRWLRGW